MDDEPQVEQLENRIDKLESTIEKMIPSRRDALKIGGAALVGGAAMSGTASAGTNQVGTIGSASQPVDLESEDINNADTITTQDNNVDYEIGILPPAKDVVLIEVGHDGFGSLLGAEVLLLD